MSTPLETPVPCPRSRIPAARSRIGAGARAACQSEPSSPRGTSSGSLLGEDGPVLLDELLPPGLPGEGDGFWAAVGAGGGGASGAPTPSSSDNIRVYVRVRPPSSREVANSAQPCLDVLGGQTVVLSDASRPDPFTATFDREWAACGVGWEAARTACCDSLGDAGNCWPACKLVNTAVSAALSARWLAHGPTPDVRCHCCTPASFPCRCRPQACLGPRRARRSCMQRWERRWWRTAWRVSTATCCDSRRWCWGGCGVRPALCSCYSCCSCLFSRFTASHTPPSFRHAPIPKGFNSSIFVYGQTGAGKTHTITGDVARGEDGALAEQASRRGLPGEAPMQHHRTCHRCRTWSALF